MPAAPQNLAPLTPLSGRQLALVGASSTSSLPALFLRTDAGARRFWEFFTANIRNKNTRKAYFVAVSRFSDWCQQKKITLEQVQPNVASASEPRPSGSGNVLIKLQ